jgi:hypothetical protein
VAGQRRHDHVEGVGGVAAVAPGSVSSGSNGSISAKVLGQP